MDQLSMLLVPTYTRGRVPELRPRMSLERTQEGMALMSRSGTLEVAKECSEYKGLAGDHCTLTASNIPELGVGTQIVYADAASGGTLDTAISLESGPGNTAHGRVVLDLASGTGRVTLSDGTGSLAGIQAKADVSADAAGIWHWKGTYSFSEIESPAAAIS
jgi:hypothetical protein